MTDNSDTRKLDAIVGSAIRALVESGADDEFIGSFSANHRIKVAGILEQSAATSSPPDLQSVVAQAVTQALSAAGIVGKQRNASQRVNVIIAGRRTSVTLGVATIEKLIEAKGGKSQAKELVQEMARTIPTNVENRSGWLEERLQAFLTFQKNDPHLLPRH